MAEVIKMPKLSDTMEEGVIAEWHKNEGDKVQEGEVLAEIETDKATMEFESFFDGVLLYKGLDKGESAPVDQLLAIIGEEGEDVQALIEEEKKKAEEGKAEQKEEKEAETATEESSEQKASGPEKGTHEAPSKEKVAPGPPTSTQTPAAAKTDSPSITSDGRVKASPLARRMASEKGIPLEAVKGTGYEGRIIKRDIENFKGAPKAAQPYLGVENTRKEAASQMRKTIAKRLSESKFTAPHFYLTMEIAMERAIAARSSINKAIEPAKVSFNDLIIKAASVALRKHPDVNVSFDGEHMLYHDHVHMGVAVAVKEGLLVPVVRFADGKPLTQLSTEVSELAERARQRDLQPEEWEGSTFTISNLGMYGIEHFTAIINPPNACILAVSGIQDKPVVRNGAVVPGKTMNVTLSCDHRAVDGATGSAFLQTLKSYLEEPVLFLGAAEI